MKFKPKPAADPFGALIRTSERFARGEAVLPKALAETPIRSGPFAAAAADVALVNPPRTRVRRDKVPWAGVDRQRVYGSRRTDDGS
jgi:hypothetical protein